MNPIPLKMAANVLVTAEKLGKMAEGLQEMQEGISNLGDCYSDPFGACDDAIVVTKKLVCLLTMLASTLTRAASAEYMEGEENVLSVD